MTVYELRRLYRRHQPDGHFFDIDTLRFFGGRLSEMRVLTGTVIVEDYSGVEHECYTLSSYQRNAPNGVNPRRHHYFDINTFDVIIRK